MRRRLQLCSEIRIWLHSTSLFKLNSTPLRKIHEAMQRTSNCIRKHTSLFQALPHFWGLFSWNDFHEFHVLYIHSALYDQLNNWKLQKRLMIALLSIHKLLYANLSIRLWIKNFLVKLRPFRSRGEAKYAKQYELTYAVVTLISDHQIVSHCIESCNHCVPLIRNSKTRIDALYHSHLIWKC